MELFAKSMKSKYQHIKHDNNTQFTILKVAAEGSSDKLFLISKYIDRHPQANKTY